MDDRLAFSPEEVASLTGLDKHTVYRAIKKGELRAVKRMSRWLIPHDSVREFIGATPRVKPRLDPEVAHLVEVMSQ